jgi:trimeric autotransporter adhesin
MARSHAYRLRFEPLEQRQAPAIVTTEIADLNKDTIGSIPGPSDYYALSGDPTTAPNWVSLNGDVYFAAHQGAPGYASFEAEVWKTDGTAAGTKMVKDIVPGFFGVNPGDYTILNGKMLFTADDFVHGRELYITDGTEAGTEMVVDLQPGSRWPANSSWPSYLTEVNGEVFFTAYQTAHPYSLWKTDGTAAGTVAVKDITPPSGYGGSSGAEPEQLTDVNGTLFFTCADGGAGRALWKSDGTPQGTTLVVDADPGDLRSTIQNLSNLNGTAIFTSQSVDSHNNVIYELWKSDGTSGGTSVIATFVNSPPGNFVAFNGKIYFSADDGTHGNELWTTDGTSAGTRMVTDIYTLGSGGSYPKQLTVANSALYFMATDTSHGTELWKTDGTTAGTVLVVDFTHGVLSSNLQNLTAAAGTLFFTSQDVAKDDQLWKTDGTAAGTVLVQTLNPGVGSATLASPFGTPGWLYFSADDGMHGREIWRSDGTAAHTGTIADINTVTAQSVGNEFTPVNGVMYFPATDGVHGWELWRSDGTAAGTTMVKDISPGYASALRNQSAGYDLSKSGSDYLTNLNGALYFVADDGTHGLELWKSDGTAAGTVMVKDISTTTSSTTFYGSQPRELAVYNGKLYFNADDGTHGRELWVSDGTTAGTVMLKDINPGLAASTPTDLVVSNGSLFFSANDGTHGAELWKTDGTAAGTVMVKDIQPGSGSGLKPPDFVTFYPLYLTDVAGVLYFVADDGSHGRELWRSDGTADGTTMVADVAPSNLNAFTRRYVYAAEWRPDVTLSVLNGIIYFSGQPTAGGYAILYRSDGTAAGTYPVSAPSSSTIVMDPRLFLGALQPIGNTLYFEGRDATHGWELWKTDGTVAGTAMIKDIQVPDLNPYYPGSCPFLMAVSHGMLYFSAADSTHGRELWRSDGTAAGTVMVKDINAADPYYYGSYPADLTDANGTLFFSANDGVSGSEPWTVAYVPPAAAIGPINPNMRNTPVDSIPITFSEPVTGFDLSDLSLTLNGVSVSLSGATLTTNDNTTFTLGNLGGLTTAEGTYVLNLPAAGSGIVDADQIPMAADAAATWAMDTTPPAVTGIAPVSPNPRNTSVDLIDATFSEPINLSTFTAANLALSLDGSPVALDGITVTPVSGSTYQVGGLAAATAAEGAYQFTVDATGISDLAGNAGFGSASTGWIMDTTPPTVAGISPITPDPRNTAVDTVDVTFSEPIDPTTFDPTDVALSRDGSSVAFSGLSITELSASRYEVSGLAAFTAAEGAYALTVDATGVQDLAGNAGSGTGSVSWTMDVTPPTETVNQAAGQADPTNGSIRFDVVFSEPVVGFDASRVDLSASTASGHLSAVVTQTGTADYQVTVTGMTSSGTVVAAVDPGVVTDLAGNPNPASTSTDNTVTFDNTPPTVTIGQAVGQADPTNVPSIKFSVNFSEPVTGFDKNDVSLAGSTAGGTLVVAVSGSLDTYTVIVTGETTRGLVIASIPVGGASDAAGNSNVASTSTDNSVEFLNTGTLGFTAAVYNATETSSSVNTVTIMVTRAGQTDGAVSINYGTSDGTAHSSGNPAIGQADYTPTSGALSWADGEGGDKTFTVDILPEQWNSGTELFNLTLTNAVGSPGLARTTAAVAIAPHDGQGPGTYLDSDGDKYTIKLTGNTASLLYYRDDPNGTGTGPIDSIVLTAKLPQPLKAKLSSLSVVVTKSKSKSSPSDGFVNIGAIVAPGVTSLASISAARVNLDGKIEPEGIDLSGYLGSLTIGNVINGGRIATGAAKNPKQKTRITALAIGDGSTIDIGANVSSFTATSFGVGTFTAPTVGTLTIRGDMSANLNITGGVAGSPKKSLGTLRVKGVVERSDISVNGDVGGVAVGAFRDSLLYAGYSGADNGSGAGGLGFYLPATVSTFRSTGKQDGFENSRVIATNIRMVTLASADTANGEAPFGFDFHGTFGGLSVRNPKLSYDKKIGGSQVLADDLTVDKV